MATTCAIFICSLTKKYQQKKEPTFKRHSKRHWNAVVQRKRIFRWWSHAHLQCEIQSLQIIAAWFKRSGLSNTFPSHRIYISPSNSSIECISAAVHYNITNSESLAFITRVEKAKWFAQGARHFPFNYLPCVVKRAAWSGRYVSIRHTKAKGIEWNLFSGCNLAWGWLTFIVVIPWCPTEPAIQCSISSSYI